MTASMNLITAQISFLEGRFALIHIPLHYYPFFLQPIQRLLFGEDHGEDADGTPWPYRHGFLNVSITPAECSLVCSRELAVRFFEPLVDRFNGLQQSGEGTDHVQISPEDFNVIQVDGQGLDAGQRVLELTSPLALAGISIFFETTYFSDYILVPHKSIHTVRKTLEQRGFTFSHSAAAYVSEHSPSSPVTPRHPLQSSPGNPFDFTSSLTAPPSTPPATNIDELQTQTFAKLKRAGIVPSVDRSIRLVSCAGRKETNPALDTELRDDLLQILLATCPGTPPPPSPDRTQPATGIPHFSTRFLSLTLTSDEPISLLLESSLLSNPNLSLSSTLLFSQSSTTGLSIPTEATAAAAAAAANPASGAEKDVLIPITLDLRDLPLEATGIVCGVAGRLVQGATHHQTKGKHRHQEADETLSPKTTAIDTLRRGLPPALGADNDDDDPSAPKAYLKHVPEEEVVVQKAVLDEECQDEDEGLEISFLSTARAGTVIVRERELERAVRALRIGEGMV